MMLLLYLLTVVTARTDSALGKVNGIRRGSVMRFNGSKATAAALLAAAATLLGGFEFDGASAGMGVFYGISLAASMCAGLMALSLGSMAITSMLASFSLIIPALVGILFLKEKLSATGAVGFVLLILSVLLLNVKKGTAPISPKCWFYSFLTMVTNGICSVIQKLHQYRAPGLYQKEFMLFAMVTAAIVLVAYGLWKKEKPVEASKKQVQAHTILLGALAGICNCIANFLTLTLAATENASVLFPILSAANSIGAVMVGGLIFHERLTRLQTVSVAVGIASVVLLKL